ncbi:MAG: type I-E CRISPR-associated protein Cse2/CasB [Gemmatimonadaceae bacterium]
MTGSDKEGDGWSSKRVLEWWSDNFAPRDPGDPQSSDPDSAARARLRRCRSPVDAATVPTAVSLSRRLGVLSGHAHSDDRRVIDALNLARILAHVIRNDDERRPMQAAGWPEFPGSAKDREIGKVRPRLAEARFRRLLQTEGGEELVTAFTRLIALLGGTVDVVALAEAYWFWNERTKRRWAFDYYAATPTEITNDKPINLEGNVA